MHRSPSSQTDRNGPQFPLCSWIFPATIIIFTTLVEIFGDAARALLRFDRTGLVNGDWWRLASGHFAHLGWQHLALNISGLVLIWLLVGRAYSQPRWAWILAATAVGTSAGLWWLSPQLQWYVGLSGVLHGLLVAGLLGRLRSVPVESGILLAAVILKLSLEQWSGPLPGSEAAAGGPVVTAAHLYGAVTGAALALPWLIRDFRKAAI